MVVGTVVQVTNISSSVTDKQLRDLFGIFGDVLDLRIYPSTAIANKPRLGFVKYDEHETCLVAQHLSDTFLLDRALTVVPVAADEVPDEKTALAASEPSEAARLGLSTSALAATAQSLMPQPRPLMGAIPMPTAMSVPSVVPSMSTMPTMSAMSAMPAMVGGASSLNLATIQPMAGINPVMQCLSSSPVACQLVTGMQAKAGMSRALWDAIAASAPPVSDPPLPGMVPAAPALGGNVDPTKIEEIRRTVYVGNLNTQLLGEALVPFFAARCGDVLYVRMAGDETQPTRFVFIEFAETTAVNLALQYNGAMFGDRPLKVNHSKNAVVKPQVKTVDIGQKEVSAAMEAVRKAQAAISQQIEPEVKKVEPSRSKSPSPAPKSRERRRSGSRERRRSRSRDRRRSTSRDRRRSTSRDRRDRRRSTSRDRDRRRDRHNGRYDRRDRDRDRDRDDYRRRDRSPANTSRSSRRRTSRSPDRVERRRSRSRDRAERKRRRSASRSPVAARKRRSTSRSPVVRKRRSTSRSPVVRKRRSTSRSPVVRKRRSPSSDSSPDRRSSKKHKRRDRSRERKRSRHASVSPPRPPPPTAATADDEEDDNDMDLSESE